MNDNGDPLTPRYGSSRSSRTRQANREAFSVPALYRERDFSLQALYRMITPLLIYIPVLEVLSYYCGRT